MLEEILKDFDLDEIKIEKLNKLRKICLEYNKHTNLTSITEENEFNIKHILDSISIINFFNLNNKKILDVGSGGGFPGLVLAIVLNDSEITMLDSNNKKIKYIDYAINELNLKNAKTLNCRVEESNLIEEFDFVISRAVAPLNILIEITANLIKINGLAIFYKGSNYESELAKKWIDVENKLGLNFYNVNNFNLNFETKRYFVSFKKFKQTNKNYPRIYSKIKKGPIF